MHMHAASGLTARKQLCPPGTELLRQLVNEREQHRCLIERQAKVGDGEGGDREGEHGAGQEFLRRAPDGSGKE